MHNLVFKHNLDRHILLGKKKGNVKGTILNQIDYI